MKISYNWLKEIIDFELSAEQLAEKLTFQGLETTVEESSGCWKGVITAKVLEKGKHPNADKLSLCLVSDGTNKYSVVCGAQNVDKDQVIALAMLGAELPGGFKIEGRKIRGVESQGMICSAKELGLKEESEGIMVLKPETPLGKPLESILEDSDTILSVETSTNRGDCLSYIGIAREISALTGNKLKVKPAEKLKVSGGLKITIKNNDLCTRYIGVRISDIQVKPSPEWLRKKLEKSGIRPINNVVDITNYCMLEYGHPMHAFDAGLLEGNEIVVRNAAANEKILALDTKEYPLKEDMLVIADCVKPQAIAGIMGGEHSGVTEKTKSIVLESALFNPSSVRKTSKSLKLSSDSSYRFERGVAWDICEDASNKAVELIREICCGKIESRADVYMTTPEKKNVTLRHERVKKLLGLEVEKDKILSILNSLEISSKLDENNNISSIIPYFRNDISQEADIIEEIARINGYDKIPTTMMPVLLSGNEGRKQVNADKILAQKLVEKGFHEAFNYSFMSEAALNEYGFKPFEKISNPISKENEAMRPSMFPGLMNNLKLNVIHGETTVKLFESSKIFLEKGEKNILALIMTGYLFNEWWGFENNKADKISIDFLYAKGIISNIFGSQQIKYKSCSKDVLHIYHPGKCIEINLYGKVVGYLGVVSPIFNKEISNDVVYAELYLDQINWNSKTPAYKQIKRFPQVKRDLCLVADVKINYSEIESVIEYAKKKSTALLNIFENYVLFSRYEAKDSKSVSYSFHFTFQHADHTLSEQEINAAVDDLLKMFKEKLNMTLKA